MVPAMTGATIGARIKRRRDELGMTQQQLAAMVTERRAAVGDTTTTYQGDVSHWEGDRSTPSTSALVPLAEALDVTVDWLLGRDETLAPTGT
jgi:transcriptional regulator with XRE-family HTH domain